MKKVFLFVFAAISVLLCAVGCSEPVVFSEVFQQGENEKLYTAYNIWYTNPEDISCLNVQQGAFIPIGTEIEPVETSVCCNYLGLPGFNERISFKDKSGKLYTINFQDGYRLCSMRDYIFYTFTKKNRDELLKDVSEPVKKHILRGEVVPGMSEAEVKLCYGPPPAIRTPNLSCETWIYWLTPEETIRLIFRGGKVRSLLNLNKR